MLFDVYDSTRAMRHEEAQESHEYEAAMKSAIEKADIQEDASS
jgi:hypothetical protein